MLGKWSSSITFSDMEQEIGLTRISSKGQIVIPQELRAILNLKEGNLLIATAQDETICLKKLELPKIKTWKEATKPFREAAEKSGFKKEDLGRLIAESKAR